MTKTDITVSAIIPAAGFGSRMENSKIPKQFMELNGKEILRWTLEAVASSTRIKDIYLVVASDQMEQAGEKYKDLVTSVIEGGDVRNRSVFNGVIASISDFVLVHDAARPCLTSQVIDRTITAAIEHGAATAALPVVDTLKRRKGDFLAEPIDRNNSLLIQTPQVFNRELLLSAYAKVKGDEQWTDETSMLEHLGIPVAWVRGNQANIKITSQEDLSIAAVHLSS